jgi:hypothetical protein
MLLLDPPHLKPMRLWELGFLDESNDSNDYDFEDESEEKQLFGPQGNRGLPTGPKRTFDSYNSP